MIFLRRKPRMPGPRMRGIHGAPPPGSTGAESIADRLERGVVKTSIFSGTLMAVFKPEPAMVLLVY